MRERNIKKQYWLNAEENNLLNEKASKEGITESDFIRLCIKGYQVKEKHDENFYFILRDLRGSANNINQLAREAHSLRYVNENKFWDMANKVSNFITDIQELYLIPVKKDIFNFKEMK